MPGGWRSPGCQGCVGFPGVSCFGVLREVPGAPLGWGARGSLDACGAKGGWVDGVPEVLTYLYIYIYIYIYIYMHAHIDIYYIICILLCASQVI